jgi:hypothetical protein
MNPPRPSRAYWFCQVSGWGAFTAYVLSFYVIYANPRHAWDYFSIIFTNGVICPAITHGLRREFYRRGWLQRPIRQVVLPLAATVSIISAALTVAVWAAARAVYGGAELVADIGQNPVPWISMMLGFMWAFSGWLVIYFSVHGRRRNQALQLELAVVSRDAQLRALRAQVNPHFLFNSLNSLRHLILANPERAVTMVTGLADLLRYSLASDRVDMVPLGDELSIVDEYLGLEQVRLEERLRVERIIDPAALSARVPPMLVQSLVDNAIKHGVATLPQGGIIRLSARVQGTGIELTVANTGVLKAGEDAGSGLTNARERLRILYDGQASLTLRQDGSMTVADLRIPAAAPTRADELSR